MKVFISGPITGVENYRDTFHEKKRHLEAQGHVCMNPAVLPYPGFEHEEYMRVCLAMIDVCDAVYFIKGWEQSIGSNMEHSYAIVESKILLYES